MLAKLNATVMWKNKGQTQFHITASMTFYKPASAALVRSSILKVENYMYSVKDVNHKKKWINTDLLKQRLLLWHVLILFGNNANTVDLSLLKGPQGDMGTPGQTGYAGKMASSKIPKLAGAQNSFCCFYKHFYGSF